MRLRRRREREAPAAAREGHPEGASEARGRDGEGRPVGEAGRRPAGYERRERRGIGMRTRDGGAAAVGAFGSAVLVLARLVMTLAVLIALLIGLAIVLRDVGANQANTIVEGIHEGGNFFAGVFTGLISFSGHPKRAITVNWGVALLVYLIVGAIIAGAIARIGRGGVRYERRHRALPT